MEVVPAVSVTVLLGTGGVHGSGSYPLKHCVIGYWRCTWRWSLTSQALWYWVLAMYMEVVSYLSSTVLWGTGGVHGGGVLAVYMEMVSNLSSTVLWGTGGVHGGGVLAVYMEVVSNLSSTVLWGTGGVHGGGVLAVYMEVVSNLSSTVLWSTGGVHGGGVLAVYKEVVPAVSVTVLLGAGGVLGGGSYPLNHCVIGYWRCTWRWSLPSQSLCYWVLAVYMEVVPTL